MKERPQVNIRLERRLLAEIDDLADAERVDRSEMARRLLGAGMSSYRSEMALREYRRGTITAWKAAELAGVSLYEMLDRIHAEGIPYELDPDVLENLDQELAGVSGAASAVRDSSASYGSPADASDQRSDAFSGIADLRQQVRPETVSTLFVGESSPASGTHFYLANSNLFRATHEAFGLAFGEDSVPDGPRFLQYFRDRGCWLIDVADRPVNRLVDAKRREAVAKGAAQLADLIGDTQPERIVSVKASIGPVVREAAAEAGFKGEVIELPFPVRQWRRVYVRQLSEALKAAKR